MPRWLVSIVALAGCASPAGPVGFAETAVGLDDGGAIVLWRNAGKGDDRLVRLDPDGKRVWDKPIDGLPRLTPPIVDGDQVLLRHHHVDRYGVGWQAIAAFALDDGATRWDVALARYDGARGPSGTPVAPAYLDVTLAGGRIVAWTGDEHGQQLGAAILDDAGRLVHSAAAAGEPGSPVVAGARVMTHNGEQTQVIDTATGTPQRLAIRGRGCALGDDHIVLDGDALIALRGVDPSARRTIAQPFHPVGAAGGDQLLASCGRHGDDLVLAILVAEGAYVVIADAAGAVRRVIDLKERELSIDEDAERYVRGPFQGDLPRFVPYVSEPSSTTNAHLRVLDLEQGTIAWDGPPDFMVTMQTLFRAGDDWFVSLDGAITRIDGATGEPAASMVADHDDGIAPLRPPAIAAGRVWLTAPFHAPIDQMAITALDAKTLAPVFTRRIRVTDLAEEARAVYGRD